MNSNEIKAEVIKQYPYRTELHAHTSPASRCSDISPEEMVKTYVSRGYDAVVITNHFAHSHLGDGSKEEILERYIRDYEQTVKYSHGTSLKVLLGAELRFAENSNDYMLYGVDREILSKCFDYLDMGVEAFRKEVTLHESVFLQAHPFRDGIALCDPALLDGVETFNMHPGHNPRNGLAVRYACENNLSVKIAGSDFHHPNLGHEATTALRTRTLPETSFDIAAILKNGDYVLEIGESSIILV